MSTRDAVVLIALVVLVVVINVGGRSTTKYYKDATEKGEINQSTRVSMWLWGLVGLAVLLAAPYYMVSTAGGR